MNEKKKRLVELILKSKLPKGNRRMVHAHNAEEKQSSYQFSQVGSPEGLVVSPDPSFKYICIHEMRRQFGDFYTTRTFVRTNAPSSGYKGRKTR